MFLPVLLSVLTLGQTPYEQAVDRSFRENKPLLVQVSADWCVPCHRLTNEVILPMQKEGLLRDLVYVKINLDNDPQLAKLLMDGDGVPQLILLVPSSSGVEVIKRKKFVLKNLQPRQKVLEFIRRR